MGSCVRIGFVIGVGMEFVLKTCVCVKLVIQACIVKPVSTAQSAEHANPHQTATQAPVYQEPATVHPVIPASTAKYPHVHLTVFFHTNPVYVTKATTVKTVHTQLPAQTTVQITEFAMQASVTVSLNILVQIAV